ncbi:MAG: glycosyltransferase family 4 protein [Erythrobacter sp.]
MDVVNRLAAQCRAVCVISVDSTEPHDEILASSVRSIGLPDIWQNGMGPLLQALNTFEPTHVVLRFPSLEVLKWAEDKSISVLVTLADSFNLRAGLRGLKDRWRNRALAKLLNRDFVTFVGNHNIAAAEELLTIGVDPEKVIPWDWPRIAEPSEYKTKLAPNSKRKTIICVGHVSEAKGVGDVIRALAADDSLKETTELRVLGDGDLEGMRALAANLGLQKGVTFAGKVPFADFGPAMHEADAVIVYSQHDYGEGLPGTVYLGFAARTPLILSDHPMFLRYFTHRKDALIVPQRSPKLLASAIKELFADTELFAKLSASGAEAFGRICHPVHWGEVVERGLRRTDADLKWLREQTMPYWTLRARP